MIFKALSVVDTNVKLPPADDNVVRSWFESHRDKDDEPARYAFEEAASTTSCSLTGLLFLVGFGRRLIGTITAFTLAHSITLASSAFGWITLRSPPVEAAIALSILLVASEALRARDTLARRFSALVSFLFGLVHGLGFSGALKATACRSATCRSRSCASTPGSRSANC